MSSNLSDIIVITDEVIKYSALASLALQKDSPVYLFGVHETCKTVVARKVLRSWSKDSSQSLSLRYKKGFSWFRNKLYSPLTRKRKDVYGPASAGKLLYFIDDINVNNKIELGKADELEHFRQWINCGGWFSPETLSMHSILDVTMLMASSTQDDQFLSHKKRLRNIVFSIYIPSPPIERYEIYI